MERVLAEKSIVRYTAPLKMRDKNGHYTPIDQTIPTEISSKIDRGEVKVEELEQLLSVLDCLLPPREWEEDGELWMQQVSPEPVMRDDIVELQLLVERRLKESKAIDSGIDFIRRHIYSQLMDELIRQEATINPERAILLLKIRDELKMTLDAYQALFENGKLYGMRKSEEAQVMNEYLIACHNQLLSERDALLSEVEAYKLKYKEAQKRSIEGFIRYDNVCIDEIKVLHSISVGLKQQLGDIFAALV